MTVESRPSRPTAGPASAPALAAGGPLAVLRTATADVHDRAERCVRILDAAADVATYVRYLERMLGFHDGVESAFAAHEGLRSAGFEPERRAKRSWLAADLRALGRDPDAVARRAEPVVPGDTAGAVGAAYVLEGSTLGGRFILAHLNGALAELRGSATRFLDGYGGETGTMWRRFGAVASRVLTHAADTETAVAAARATFVALTAWLDEEEREPPFPRPSRRRGERP